MRHPCLPVFCARRRPHRSTCIFQTMSDSFEHSARMGSTECRAQHRPATMCAALCTAPDYVWTAHTIGTTGSTQDTVRRINTNQHKSSWTATVATRLQAATGTHSFVHGFAVFCRVRHVFRPYALSSSCGPIRFGQQSKRTNQTGCVKLCIQRASFCCRSNSVL